MPRSQEATHFDYDAVDETPETDEQDSPAVDRRQETADFKITPEMRMALLRDPRVRAICSDFGMQILDFVRSVKRARYAADCLVLALGGQIRMDGSTVTQTVVAAEHGVTKAAVSKTTRQFAKRLGLPPNQYNKSLYARRRYSYRNRSPVLIDGD